MRSEIAILAGPRGWGDTRESWLSRVCAAVPTVSYRTVKAIWYGEIQDPDHWAIRDIHRAVAVIEGQRETKALARQFAALLEKSDGANAVLDSKTTALLLSTLREMGSKDSAGTNKSMTPEKHIGFDPPR